MPSQVVRKRVYEEISSNVPATGKRFRKSIVKDIQTIRSLPTKPVGTKVKELVRARSLFHDEPAQETKIASALQRQEEPVPEPEAEEATQILEHSELPIESTEVLEESNVPIKDHQLQIPAHVAGCPKEVMEKMEEIRKHSQLEAFAHSSLGYRLRSIEQAVVDGTWEHAEKLCELILGSLESLEKGPPDELKNLVKDIESHYNFDKVDEGILGDWFLYVWMMDHMGSGAYPEAMECGEKLWEILELNLFVDYIPAEVSELVYGVETHEKFPTFRFSDLGYMIDDFRSSVHDRQWGIALERGKFIFHRLEVLRRGLSRPVKMLLEKVERHPRKAGFMRSAYGFYLAKMRAAAAEGDEYSAEYFASQVLQKLENLRKGVPTKLRRLEKQLWKYISNMRSLDPSLYQKYADAVREAKLSGSYDDLEYYCRRLLAILQCDPETIEQTDGEVLVQVQEGDENLQLEIELPEEIQRTTVGSSPAPDRQVEVHEEKMIRTPDGTKKISLTVCSATTTISPATHQAKLTTLMKEALPPADSDMVAPPA